MVRPIRRKKLDKHILDELGLSIEQFGELSDDEQDYLVQCLEEMSETGTSVTAADLLLEDFKWQPVSMEQFLEDPYYMGELTGKMFPLVRAALIDIFDTGKVPMYTLLGGSIGWGKSMMSSCILIYFMYRLSCLRDPHAYYNIVKGNKIFVAVYSVNLDQALDGIYGKVQSWIDQIPYFTHKCPRVKRINSSIKFTDSPIEMIVASKPDHTIGKDIFCCHPTGTLVRTERGDVPIESVAHGDRVATPSGYEPCDGAVFTGVQPIITVIGEDGSVIEATANHRFLVERGGCDVWVTADSIRPGDLLVVFDEA